MRRSGATIRQRSGRVLAAFGAGAGVWGTVALLTGGFTVRLGPSTIVSRDTVRPFLVAVVLLAAAGLLMGARAFSGLVLGWFGKAETRSARLSAATALAVLIVGLAWNTRAAGGSDSSCYLLQAQAFAHGHATLPPVAPLPPGTAPAALAPTGFVASPRPPFAPVPICAAGLALVMTPAVLVSPAAPFVVVPVFAALAVWLTFILGRQLGDPLIGTCAAMLFACSPILLYQSVQPMSDVPATAAWLAAFTFCIRSDRRGAIAGGVLASLAVLMRPNLALLVAPLPLLLTDSARWRPSLFSGRAVQEKGNSPLFRIAWFVAGGVPGAVAMLALNDARYGSPLASGYGSTNVLFSMAHVGSNLARYPRWLVETQTPFIALGIAAPWLLWRRKLWRVALVASVAVLATTGTYFAYTVFDDWWYIRFLLPALPILLVFAVLVARRLTRPGITVAICVALAGWYLHVAVVRHVFELQALESRFPVSGGYAARALPPNAVLFAVQESGALRYHGGRATVAWDGIAPGDLDAAMAWMRAHGLVPFIALEDEEEQRFRDRFHSQEAGQLDWPPKAEVHTPVRVRIYDPAVRVEYLKGGRLEPEQIWR